MSLVVFKERPGTFSFLGTVTRSVLTLLTL